MKQSRAKRLIARAKRLLTQRRSNVINSKDTIFTPTVRFSKEKLVGAVVTYGNHMIRLKAKVAPFTYTYDSVKSKQNKKFR